MQTVAFTPDNIMVLLLVIVIALFFLVAAFTQGVLKEVQDSVKKGKLSGTLVHKCARATYASAIISLGSAFLAATSVLVLGLGMGKAVVPWTGLILPDKSLGLVVLLSYCGLATAVRTVAPEIEAARKKLFG